jgi:hypothetical protein
MQRFRWLNNAFIAIALISLVAVISSFSWVQGWCEFLPIILLVLFGLYFYAVLPKPLCLSCISTSVRQAASFITKLGRNEMVLSSGRAFG